MTFLGEIGHPELKNVDESRSGVTTAIPSRNVSKTDLPTKEAYTQDHEKQLQSQSSLTSDSLKENDRTLMPNASMSENRKAAGEPIVGVENENGDDEVVYPTGLKLFLISIALCLSVFLVALDNTIIATAIPKITDRFQSLNDVGWYASSYLLTTCALQLFFGK